ncbi:hypothetical protein D3P04_04570 [Paracoccus onubensis]|uniref:Uncharacterized protein n=1 Tax=Paracoccus onubensis TaxID=1675788 RepID=A0A418T4U6_9RHOB|nr:hypothetical protein D3P04_04570 [Paracoccus onubensis]
MAKLRQQRQGAGNCGLRHIRIHGQLGDNASSPEEKLKPAVFVALFAIFPVTLLADENYGSLPMRELLDQCEAALENDPSSDAAKEIGEELLSREGVIFNLQDSTRGMICLEKIYEDEFAFDPPSGRFMKMSEAASVEGNRPERPQPGTMYERRLRSACYAKLSEDEFTALTEPLCADFFKSEGLSGQ